MLIWLSVYVYMSHPGFADGDRQPQPESIATSEADCQSQAKLLTAMLQTSPNAPAAVRHDRIVCKRSTHDQR